MAWQLFRRTAVQAAIVASILSGCGGGGDASSGTSTSTSGSGTTRVDSGSSGAQGGGSLLSAAPAAPSAAVAIPPQAVVGTVLVLDGGASADPNGDAITFSWTLSSRPSGSAAALTGTTTARPQLVPDVAGDYVVSLTVSDGRLSSNPVTATVTARAANDAPTAVAGPARGAQTGSPVMLDGTASSDPNGDALAYSWTLRIRPGGSNTVLSGEHSARPIFVPDVDGQYVADLVVSDGKVDSSASTAMVRAATANPPPSANAGEPQNAAVGSTVTLNGHASTDPAGKSLSYAWVLSTLPGGSSASLVNASSVTPSFTVDREGTYIATLRVDNGTSQSDAATVIVIAVTGAQPRPAIPGGMPVWAIADWTRIVALPNAASASLQLYTTRNLGGNTSTGPVDGQVMDAAFGAAVPGRKLVTFDGQTIDLFASPPTWSGNDQAGKLCWTLPSQKDVLDPSVSVLRKVDTHLCHLPATDDWTWDFFSADSTMTGFWSTSAPSQQQFSVLEAMRQGMRLNAMFDNGSVAMGVANGNIWTASRPVSGQFIPSSPTAQPRYASSCTLWTMTSQLLVTSGRQAACDQASQYDWFYNRWVVTSTTPLPRSAVIGSSGTLATGRHETIGLATGAVLASGQIDWQWEMRADVNASSALLCATQSIRSNTSYASRQTSARCFRVETSGTVTGIQVDEFSPYVQPL